MNNRRGSCCKISGSCLFCTILIFQIYREENITIYVDRAVSYDTTPDFYTFLEILNILKKVGKGILYTMGI